MSERLTLELEPADTLRLANLCGQFDEHLKQIEARLGVEIFCRGNLFTVRGETRRARAARRLLLELYRLSETDVLSPDVINLHLQESGISELEDAAEHVADDEVAVKTRRGIIRGRGPNQKTYLRNISANAINFGVGRPWKPVNVSDSCPGTWRRKSILTCGPCTTRSTKWSVSNASPR